MIDDKRQPQSAPYLPPVDWLGSDHVPTLDTCEEQTQRGNRERLVAARKAAVFFAQGRDRKAEAEIARALSLGESPERIADALTSVETPGAITRREALKRTGALLAAGAAWSFVRLPVGHVTSPTQSSPASSASTPTMLEGLVMQVAASEPAYYDLLTLSQSGLSSALGSFCGASVVINGQVFNCQFEWESNGSPQTSLNLVQSDGSLQAISCPYTVSLPYTAGADSLSSVVARGSFAYCLHVIIRVYPSTWASPVPAAKAQLGIQPEVITNQLVLAIVDIDAGALSGFWLGEEIKSPMATTLLVSADGTGVIVAASPPGPTSEYTLFTFGSSGLSQTGGGTTAASLVPNFCGAGLIDWPGPSLPLRQISRNCLQVLDPGSGALSLQALQRQIFNVRKPPTFRAAWQSGLSYIANADGRLFTTAASSESASPVSGLIRQV